MLWLVRLLLLLVAISPGTICLTSALAAVQWFRGKQGGGRLWAIACGVAFLICSLPILGASAMVGIKAGGFAALLGMGLIGLIHVAAGIFILIAFLPRGSADQPILQDTRSTRIKGDGTSSVSIYLATAVMICGCFLGNSLCRRWSMHAKLPTNPDFLPTNLTWLVAFVSALIVHELGHVAAGQIVGMKVLSFRISLFHVAIEQGRWRFIRPRSWSSVFAGGVTMIPRFPLSYSRGQAIVGAAGGAFANLLVGAIALLGMLTAKGSAYELLWDFLGQIATVNLATFAVNLIPVQEAATYSDGARIYQILSGSVLEDYRRVLAMTLATTVTPMRPKDFDIQLIERITATKTSGLDHVFLLLVASDCYFDKGDLESACQKARDAEILCDQEAGYWAETCGSIVLRAACLLGDATMAEKWWQRNLAAKSFNHGKKNYFPACAYFTITGRLPEAEAAWRAEFERANRLPETGERVFDFCYLTRLREMLDEAARQIGKRGPSASCPKILS